MLALKYQAYGRTYVETTNDYQSIFDMVINITGEHEHAMKAYNAATNLKWGQTADVTYQNVTVTVICYDETKSYVDNSGNIVDIRSTKILSVDEAVRAIQMAQHCNEDMQGVIFKNDTWTAKVQFNRFTGLKYFAEYHYKDGRQGSAIINIVNDRPSIMTPGVPVIQPIISKITSISKRVQIRTNRRK